VIRPAIENMRSSQSETCKLATTTFGDHLWFSITRRRDPDDRVPLHLIVYRALGGINSKHASPVPNVASGAGRDIGRSTTHQRGTIGIIVRWSTPISFASLVHADIFRLEASSMSSWPLEDRNGCATLSTGFGGRFRRHARRPRGAPCPQIPAPRQPTRARGLR
jgi:hypothetical protein